MSIFLKTNDITLQYIPIEETYNILFDSVLDIQTINEFLLAEDFRITQISDNNIKCLEEEKFLNNTFSKIIPNLSQTRYAVSTFSNYTTSSIEMQWNTLNNVKYNKLDKVQLPDILISSLEVILKILLDAVSLINDTKSSSESYIQTVNKGMKDSHIYMDIISNKLATSRLIIVQMAKLERLKEVNKTIKVLNSEANRQLINAENKTLTLQTKFNKSIAATSIEHKEIARELNRIRAHTNAWLSFSRLSNKVAIMLKKYINIVR